MTTRSDEHNNAARQAHAEARLGRVALAMTAHLNRGTQSVQPDIADCASEPIRIPGGIQAHGALLVIDPTSLKILQTSANVERLLGFKIGRAHV